MNICPNITVKEVVCPHIYQKWGDKAIRFIDPDLIEVLNVIRNKILKCPIVINNGTWKQRGMRCNLCGLVVEKTNKGQPYLTAHLLGKAIDFSCKTYTVPQVHELIKKNANLLPCKIRLESPENASSWVHFDISTYGQKEKVYTFRA
jgi:hypothetical protein